MNLIVQGTLVKEDAGLLGETYEFQPFVASWGTFGKHRLARRVQGLSCEKPVTVGTYKLPDPASVRGDEAVWIKQMVSTLFSGVDAIDAANTANKARGITAGTGRVPLADLINAAKAGEPILLPFVHTQLYSTEYAALKELRDVAQSGQRPLLEMTQRYLMSDEEIHSLATVMAYKGTIELRARLEPLKRGAQSQVDKLVLAALNTAVKGESATKLLYNSPRMLEAHKKAIADTTEAYVKDYIGAENAPPTYPLGEEKSLEHLHVPYYVSEFGPQPLTGLVQHRLDDLDPSLLALLSDDEREFYGPQKDAAVRANKLLLSSVLRANSTPEEFLASVRAQLKQSPSDASQSPGYLKALDIIGDMGTFTANRIDYTADYGFPNRAALEAVALVKSTQAAVEEEMKKQQQQASTVHQRLATVAAIARHPSVVALAKQVQSRLAATPYAIMISAFSQSAEQSRWHAPNYRTARLIGDGAAPAAGVKGKKSVPNVESEAMDPAGLLGFAPDDDCEGSATTAADELNNLKRLATCITRDEAPLLHAAVDVLQHYFVFDSIASVSSGYVNTNGEDMAREERKKITDLPFIGDSLDQRQKAGGHCPAILIAKAVVVDMIQRAGAFDLKQHAPALLKDYAAWEKRGVMYMLEGTASSDGFVLPIGEIARAVMPVGGDALAAEQEGAVRKQFLKSLAAASTPEAPSALLSLSNTEGLSFYTSPQDKRRRVSSFYLGMGMLACAELAAIHPMLGTLNVIDARTKTRGAETGRFMRSPFEPNGGNIGLVPTYAQVGHANWKAGVQPVIAAIQNQMPLACTDYFETHAEGELASMRVAHVIPTSVVTAAATTTLALDVAFDRHAKGVARRLEGQSLAAVLPRMACGDFRALEIGASAAAPAVSSSSRVAETALCFYLEPHVLATPGAMQKIFAELDAKKASEKPEVTRYAVMRDRPLLGADDLYTLMVFLPLPTK